MRPFMKTKSTPSKNVSKDLDTFESLPEKTKELSRLKDEAEKSSGPQRKKLDQSIARRDGDR